MEDPRTQVNSEQCVRHAEVTPATAQHAQKLQVHPKTNTPTNKASMKTQ